MAKLYSVCEQLKTDNYSTSMMSFMVLHALFVFARSCAEVLVVPLNGMRHLQNNTALGTCCIVCECASSMSSHNYPVPIKAPTTH